MEQTRWNRMCISEQILNIGGEVQRAVNHKVNGDEKHAREYLHKALEWLQLSKTDPKNAGRIEELTLVEEELLDYFADNDYGNDEKSIMSYWDSFLSAIY